MKEFDNENLMNNSDNTPMENRESTSNGYTPEPEAREEINERRDPGYGYGESYIPKHAEPRYEERRDEARRGYSYNYRGPYGTPYQQSAQPRDDGYRGRYTNSYVPSYGAPHQDDGNIYYAPHKVKQKKEKKKKPATITALIIVCCVAVILSGFAGFLGASLAGDSNNNVTPGNNSIIPGGNSGANNSGGTAIIYRDVEDVQTSVDKADGEALSYADVAAIVKDSVVEITTEYNMQSMWFQYVTEGAGSGVIISEDGHIITNNHVISSEDSGKIADSIKVRLTDGTEYTATVVGTDAISDIAILKIEAEGLTVAVCGNSDNLAVGEELLIVGNPLGSLGGTVTNGIVSATERTIQVNSVEMTLIQTNAAVNPGNSGGGMFNMQGHLVGIVNAKSSGTGIEGLGFAIPVNEALRVTEQLLEFGYVRGRTKIGVVFYEVNNSFFQGYYNLKNGVYVSELEKGFNDDVLKVGDRVIAVNDKEITTSAEIKTIVTSSSVGDKLKFQVYREGKLIEVTVTCYESVPSDTENNVQFGGGTEYPTGVVMFGDNVTGDLIPIK